ncbi:MAG: hypothetical protein V7609_1056 [Verrucomicrobiota bacterium]
MWGGASKERLTPACSIPIANICLFVLGTAITVFVIRVFATAYTFVRNPHRNAESHPKKLGTNNALFRLALST